MQMPKPEAAILAQRDELIRALSAFLDADQIIADGPALRAYESDGLTAYTLPSKIKPL